MQIKVLVDIIEYEDLQKILDYYNSNKSIDEEPLEVLDRCEGGFKIAIPYMKDIMCDMNRKIKQLRWSKKYLVPETYINFTEKEQILLYDSLVYALGNENVILVE
jgi:hypothetical protein